MPTVSFLVLFVLLGATAVVLTSSAARASVPVAPPAASSAQKAWGGSPGVVSGTDINYVGGFNGASYGTTGAESSGYSPPDTQLAVGPTEVVEMVNVQEEIFTKSGASLGVVPLSSIFSAGSDDIGDPRIIFDNMSQRFFASVYDFTDLAIRVAVSVGPTASSGWYSYYYYTPSSDVCADQPYIGVSSDKVVVTANDFYAGGPSGSPCRPFGAFAYGEVWVFDKAGMIAGQSNPAGYYWYFDSYFGMRPVTSTSSTAYVACTTCQTGLLIVKEFDGVPTGTNMPTVTTVSIGLVAPPDPPNASVPGTSDVLDAGSTPEIQNAVWTGTGFWLSMNDGCTPPGDTQQRSCVRLVQVSLSPLSIAANFDVNGGVGYYLLYPAITSDGFGNLGLVTSYTSSSAYPGVAVSGVKAGQSYSDFGTNIVSVTPGTGYQCQYYRSTGICRYGDYSGAALDPSDPSLIWVAGEYETPSGWATSVTAFRVGLAAVSVAYSTQDGSVPQQSPLISYSQQGAPKSGTLSSSLRTLYMDLGTTWSASASAGGTASERWSASAVPGGQVTQDENATVAYYHQYSVTPTYTVSGGGTGYGTPNVACTVFGSPVAASLGSPLWADAKSVCTFAETLPGSSGSERWAPASPDISVGGAGPLAATYYHEFLFTLEYTVSGGGSPTPPSLASQQSGSTYTAPLTGSQSGYWVDYGASWSVGSMLGGSTSEERWVTNGTTSGTVSSGTALSFTYQHQYHLTVTATPASAGAQPAGTGWYNAGATVNLSVRAGAGWKFEGWSGNGTGAYSGPSASESFTLGGPATETALFYPGLTVSISGSGSVGYSYGTTVGTISAGGNNTIYAPLGTTLTITPSPSSFLYSFTGWSGALSGSTAPDQVQLNGPTTVSASFGYNLIVIAGLAIVVLAAALGVVILLRRRGGRLPPPPPP